jgi:hypothetical protein
MAISVRFLFLMPLRLQTPAACVRPLVELTGFDSDATVNGAPISILDDMLLARHAKSAWVVVRGARERLVSWVLGEKVPRSGRNRSCGR